MKRLFIVAGLLFLAGCAVNATATANDPVLQFVTRLTATTTADLTTAQALATKVNDTQGVACYTALLTVQANVNGAVTSLNGGTAGIFTANEVARAIALSQGGENSIKQAIENGCAPMVADEAGSIVGAVGFWSQLAGLVKLAPLAAGA